MSVIKYLKYVLILPLALTFPFIICFFLFFRGLLHLYLTYKHGDTFYGLMNSYDTIWEVHDASRGQINILATFDYDEEKNGDVYENFCQQISKPEFRRSCRKVSMRRRRIFGYNYFLEMDPFDDGGPVKRMKTYDNEEDVRRILSECSNEPIGVDDDKLLEFLVGTKPIRFGPSGKLEYPLIMKIHHCLGDGIALMNLCIMGLGRNPVSFLKKTNEDYRKIYKIKNQDQADDGRRKMENHGVLDEANANINKELDINVIERKKARNVNKTGTMQLGKLLRKVMTSKFYHPLFGRPDENLLHGKPLTGRKNLVWSRGDMGNDYVRTVKNIKSRFDAVSFNNVLFAALSASFSKYYQKHDPGKVPDYILTAIALLPILPKFEDTVTILDDKIATLNLSNNFVFGFLRIPLVTNDRVEDNLLSLVERIKKEIISLSQSVDILMTSFFMKYFAYIMPIPICKFALNYFDGTVSLSNLPGLGRLEMFHGGHMNELYFWTPNLKKIGIGLSMFTYDNRLRVGLIADEALIPDVQDAQEIVDNIFKYLDLLDTHSKCFQQ